MGQGQHIKDIRRTAGMGLGARNSKLLLFTQAHSISLCCADFLLFTPDSFVPSLSPC